MAQTALAKSLKVGKATLQHRLVMAPLTRYRADDDHVPLPNMVKEYYEQRASVPGTLIITEAAVISPQAGGYRNVPGIYNSDQIKAWQEITSAVHAKKSFIYMQLWALGRVAHPDVLKVDGFEVKSASAIPQSEGKTVPKEMTIEDIKSFVADFAQAAKNAIEAGFDGVELHGANGYLIDQFIQDVSNQRTDAYGGSIENRARFAVEAVQAVVDAVGADKVGIRLSPFSEFQGMKMKEPVPQFTYVIEQLKKLKLAYLHVVKSRNSGNADIHAKERINFAVDAWDNTSPVLLADGFTPEIAKKLADEEFKDRDVAIVFGRHFVSTPDLPFRVLNDIPLAKYDRTTFYEGSVDGYTDYPFSEEWTKRSQIPN